MRQARPEGALLRDIAADSRGGFRVAASASRIRSRWSCSGVGLGACCEVAPLRALFIKFRLWHYLTLEYIYHEHALLRLRMSHQQSTYVRVKINKSRIYIHTYD